MDASRLAPGSHLEQQDKIRRVRDAQEMYQTIKRNCERSNAPIPDFQFLELIGKGAYGRVYKCLDKQKGRLVAIKITNVDDQDWNEDFTAQDSRDGTIRDFATEVSTLHQLRANGVRNVNVIHDAFDLHSQLWIIADYCTGGSVRTLLRPFVKDGKPSGLPEKYIIPIARELAVAIQGIHNLSIIHRDIKCANVYITEDGDIQLGDFGIVGILSDRNAKRNTVIGTPHWMPLEMTKNITADHDLNYGTEIDIWAFGITLYEMATGAPPNMGVHRDDLAEHLQEAGAPRLQDEQYSEELRDLIALCLDNDPKARPTAEELLEHPAIANTEQKYSTQSLIRLIEQFKVWEHGGGSRASLWFAGPNDPKLQLDDDDAAQVASSDDLDGWNFSTSETFDRRFSRMSMVQDDDPHFISSLTPSDSALRTLKTNMSVAERIKQEHSAMSADRGERALAALFDPDDATGYQIVTPIEAPSAPLPPPQSDLPLRSFTSNAPTRESMIEIDLDEGIAGATATSTFALHMDAINEDTMRPLNRQRHDDDDDEEEYQRAEDSSRRDTMDWKFPSSAAAPASQLTMSQAKRGTMQWSFETAGRADPEEDEFANGPPPFPSSGGLPLGFRPGLKHATTEPVDNFRDYSHDMAPSSALRESVTSMIDLDAGLVDPPARLHDPAEIVRPSTANSFAGSTMTDMTSGNPFDLEEDQAQNEVDRNRFSHHKQWQSEGGPLKRNSHKTMQMHVRGTSLSSTDSEMDAYDKRRPSLPFSIEQGIGLSRDEPDPWEGFTSYDGPRPNPDYAPGMAFGAVPSLDEPVLALKGAFSDDGMDARSREPSNEPSRPEVVFPAIEPLRPNALAEDADPALLEDQLQLTLRDLSDALSGAWVALRTYANIDGDEGQNGSDGDGPEMESGFESMRETEDEDAQNGQEAIIG